MATAYDFWLTNDPRDTSQDAAIEQLASELVRDPSECLDAARNVEHFESALASAFMFDTPEAWAQLRTVLIRQRDEWLRNRAIDLLDTRAAA